MNTERHPPNFGFCPRSPHDAVGQDMNFFFFHPPNSPNLYCGWYRRPYYQTPRPGLPVVLCTHRAQGVLLTKMELWIPPSSSYVSNVTARLRGITQIRPDRAIRRCAMFLAPPVRPGALFGSIVTPMDKFYPFEYSPVAVVHPWVSYRNRLVCNLYTLLAQWAPHSPQYLGPVHFHGPLTPPGGPAVVR